MLNEIVWRNTSTNVWVDFKVFGVMPLTFLFGALQVPLLKKYAAEPAEWAGLRPCTYDFAASALSICGLSRPRNSPA